MEAVLGATLATSRFFTLDDPRTEYVAGVRLPQRWWSRFHEYAWASQFAGPGLTALDAGCGVSHPFKWALALAGCDVLAVDVDPRIGDTEALLDETAADLGEPAAERVRQLLRTPLHYRARREALDFTCGLPVPPRHFDRIFCISVLEHMEPADRAKALAEFARLLAPGGLVVLTVDVPPMRPLEMIAAAADAGLIPAGPVETSFTGPGGCLGIYRLLLKGAA